MAMRGKECVAIAADRRFGIQAQMVTTDFQKIFPMGERLYIGLAGLATDVQTVWVSPPGHDDGRLLSTSTTYYVFREMRYYYCCWHCLEKWLKLYSLLISIFNWIIIEYKTLVVIWHLCIVCRAQRLKFRLNLYELKEGRQIKPKTFMSMVSNLLYERRWVQIIYTQFNMEKYTCPSKSTVGNIHIPIEHK